MKLEILEARHVDDQTGRTILTFTPCLTGHCAASGSLTFAVWQVWADEPHTYEQARQSALENAKTVLAQIA